MGLKIGLVGMPNAGKSTLFNAITKLQVPAENYPFNTIDPNIGVVPVEDASTKKIAEMIQPDSLVYNQVEFYDIAGLVKGASKGEGLGNQFLSHIREVDAIVIVLREFPGSSVQHTLGGIDPLRDKDVLLTELQLKDLETLQKRYVSLERFARTDEKLEKARNTIKDLLDFVESGKNAREYELPEDENIIKEYQSLQLLTTKPVVYLINTDDLTQSTEALKKKLNLSDKDNVVAMDVKLECDLVNMDEDERKELMQELEIKDLQINQLIQSCYEALDQIIYITAGKPEVRAWSIPNGATALEAAGKIHNDFIAKFIAAEVVPGDTFIAEGGWENCKKKGLAKLESRDYIVKNRDVIYFRIGA